jgi:sigma-E factor negative regulatory protein RseC
MIEEQGTVVAVRGNLAEVQTERRGGCDGCGSSTGCGTALIDRFLGRRAITLRAWNQAGASVGERVVVGVSEGGLLAAACAAYLVPLLGLVIGGALGQRVGGADVSALIGSALGFALALSWLRRYSARRARQPEHDPVVLRRLGGETSLETPPCAVDRP